MTTREDAEMLDWLDDMPADFTDDTTDMRDRSGVSVVLVSANVEHISRKGQPHIPGSSWQASSCLCICHFVRTDACDDVDCKAWRKQNNAHVERIDERKRARWLRKQERAGGVA